jgi:4-amino-4-deoxy-L-arabinose transferase-like glycosyltransferase
VTVAPAPSIESDAEPHVVALARGPVLGIGVASVALLLAFAARYGYHRDELYFLAASRHLALGYVDQPPVAVLVAWLDRVALGDGLVGLRLVPALVAGTVVVLTGLMARELGGSRFAQGLAAACAATGGVLAVGHLEGPTVYDVLVWTLASWLVLRVLRTGDSRLWVAVGLTVGLGMEAKQTIPLLFVGLAVGFLTNGQRAVFTSPWLWAGVGLALAGAAPNLIWQATHSWPTLSMDASLHAEHSGLGAAIKFPFITLLAAGALLVPVWLAGAWALWGDRSFRTYRAFAVAAAIGAVFVWVYIPDRFYYLFGFFPTLFAAGAIVTEGVVDGRRGFFRRVQRRRARLWRSRRVAAGIVIVNALVFLPVGLPVLPRSAVAAADLNKINYNLGEEIGWHDLVRQVDEVWRTLPGAARRHAVLLTANYGEAGALLRFAGRGPSRVYSGHNSFWSWGPPPDSAATVVTVGYEPKELASRFATCRLAARVHNSDDVHNDEDGEPISVCRDPTVSWHELWSHFKHYG